MPPPASVPAGAVVTRRREPCSSQVRRHLLVAVPLALLLSACATAQGNTASPDATSDATSGGAADDTVTYRVAKYTFPDLTVAPGTRVEVRNGDDEPHTVTAEDGSFDTGAFDSDDPGTFTAPSEPGTYRITCTVHPSMHGQITVRQPRS
jgi:plastocyanin